ncbi:hypothetical protein E3T55_18845 [Cryobacterium frigoriphilum]|uniref:Toxin n=1 Tax=Cryobacterium frigoriphilum TaxID=1259150 RepID=A0A4R8ZTP7_9MICO|nr:hypothetical protein [Cryobacterium frigoriphilum]TFD45390.1 hypothetical protein E3T55_18845 [Cryobacterium frigoriphilum]
MPPRWESSSDKHGVDRVDQIYAILHANYTAELPGAGRDDGIVTLFIGPQHEQTDREVEILVNVFLDGRESVIFHAMLLGPKLRRYREENPNV